MVFLSTEDGPERDFSFLFGTGDDTLKLRRLYPFVWQKRLFVLGALGALAWVSILQAP